VLHDPTPSNPGRRGSIRQPLKKQMPNDKNNWSKVFPFEKLNFDREDARQPHLTPIRTNS